jgi:hypothetical protein
MERSPKSTIRSEGLDGGGPLLAGLVSVQRLSGSGGQVPGGQVCDCGATP